MFQTLLHSRARVKCLDTDGSGGWILDGEEHIEKNLKDKDSKAWNMYVGMEIHSVNIMALT